MQKQIYLSVFIGLIFNTLFFAQAGLDTDNKSQKEIEIQKVIELDSENEALTEITIERTIIDEDGNETKYVIKKVGSEAEDLLSEDILKDHIEYEFKDNPDGDGNVKTKSIILLQDIDDDEKYKQRQAHWIKKGHRPTGPKPKVLMGIELEDTDEGVRIGFVGGNSAAKIAGLQAGDMITLLDNQPVASHQEVIEMLMTKEPGEDLLVHFERDGEEQSTNMALKPNRNHEEVMEEEQGDCRYIDKPCLGVYFNSWNDGIRITGIFDESGAEFAGLQEGDQILSVNGQVYSFTSQFDRAIKSQEPGTKMTIRYERDGEQRELEAEVGVWDNCGVCRLMSEEENAIEPHDATSGVRNELALAEFEMYPVPARDQLTVSFEADRAPLEVTFYDVNGRIVDQQKINDFPGSFNRTYALNDVAKGLALITITQNGKSVTKQAMIQ